MVTGWPIDSVTSGSTTVGMTAASARQIVAAQFPTAGVMSGCGVSTSSSAMSYSVAAGVAVATRGPAYGSVLVPVPATTVTTDEGPASGTRTDYVYALQHDPSQGDTDNSVVVSVAKGTTPPTGAVVLATFSVPAGARTTSAATVAGSVNYAIPYGGSLGVLHDDTNTMDGVGDSRPSMWYTEQHGSFFLPTDRRLQFRFTATISTQDDWSDTAHGGWYMAFRLDGTDLVGTEISLDRTWAVKQVIWDANVAAGSHTVAIHSHHVWGSAPWFHYSPASGSGQSSYLGRRFQVIDQGVAA